MILKKKTILINSNEFKNNIMKKTTFSITSFLFMFIPCLIHAQSNKDLKVADEYFKKENYLFADENYKKVLEKSAFYPQEVLKRIAISNYKIEQYTDSEKYFELYMNNFDNKSHYGKEEMYMYYDVLIRNNKNASAKKVMDQFIFLYPNDSRALKYEDSRLSMANIESASALFEKERLFENSKDKLTGVAHAIVGNKILFSSNKDTTFLKGTKFLSGRHDYDLFSLDVNSNKDFILKDIKEIKSLGDINSEFDDYGFASSLDGKKIFYVSNRPVKKKKKNTPEIYRNIIYYLTLNSNGSWGEPKPVSFDDGISEYRMPSLSKDGKKLYFASNKKGGIGGYDIYSVDMDDLGIFKNVKNLGPMVNTEMDEDTPYISSNNILYFSSNGFSGFGGFDIYSYKINGTNETATNLGKNINSSNDDISFLFDEDRKVGFYSTKVGHSFVVQKVSRIDKEYNPAACQKVVSVVVYDIIDKKPLAKTEVSLYDAQGMFLQKNISDSNGFVLFTMNCLDPNIYLQVIAKDYIDTGKLIYKIEDESSRKNVKIGLQLVNTYKGAANEGLFIKTNYINFDFNGYSVSPESKLVLNELFNTIKPYQGKIHLNIYSHADNRGDRLYNLNLTKRRANMVLDYLVSKGFPITNIHAIAKGEDAPVVDCNDNCTEEQNKTNRKTIFEIKSIED